MTSTLSSRSSTFNLVARQLDPPADRLALARRRYGDFSARMRLCGLAHSHDVHVFTQGSGRLGTTNQDPDTGNFDIDVVVAPAHHKEKISQERLNETITEWVDGYVKSRRPAGGELAPTRWQPKRRAVTIHYADGFHIDVLPVVPDLGSQIATTVGTAHWLTDKDFHEWLPTHPEGFAKWFTNLSLPELFVFARARSVEVEALPWFPDRTALQRVVQILKRHRDVRMTDPDLRPPSIVVTTLAALAYQSLTPHSEDVQYVLTTIAPALGSSITKSSLGDLVIPNPTCAVENYADRYKGDHAKTQALFTWLTTLADDIAAIDSLTGPSLGTRIGSAFGATVSKRVSEHWAGDVTAARASGTVGVTATGLITTSPSIKPSPSHTFYGR